MCRFVARRGSKVADRMREEGFPVITLPATGRNPLSLWRARRHLRDTRPDVLHFVDAHAVTCGGLASWGLGVPARIAARHNLFPIRMSMRYRLLCDRVICVCHAVADVCRTCEIPGQMLRVVHNGCVPQTGFVVDRSTLRHRLNLSDTEFVILTAALFNRCKGHTHLLNALPQIVKRHPHVRVALAGNGPLENELRRQVGELGLAGHVRFLGFRHDIPDLMRAADLFVLSSLAEGIPAVLLEAMFGACPIVTTAVGGAMELLCDDQPENEPKAWCIPPADSRSLAAAILEAMADDQERIRRANRARSRAQAMFTVDQLVANTLTVYRELIDGPETSPRRLADKTQIFWTAFPRLFKYGWAARSAP